MGSDQPPLFSVPGDVQWPTMTPRTVSSGLEQTFPSYQSAVGSYAETAPSRAKDIVVKGLWLVGACASGILAISEYVAYFAADTITDNGAVGSIFAFIALGCLGKVIERPETLR